MIQKYSPPALPRPSDQAYLSTAASVSGRSEYPRPLTGPIPTPVTAAPVVLEVPVAVPVVLVVPVAPVTEAPPMVVAPALATLSDSGIAVAANAPLLPISANGGGGASISACSWSTRAQRPPFDAASIAAS